MGIEDPKIRLRIPRRIPRYCLYSPADLPLIPHSSPPACGCVVGLPEGALESSLKALLMRVAGPQRSASDRFANAHGRVVPCQSLILLPEDTDLTAEFLRFSRVF